MKTKHIAGRAEESAGAFVPTRGYSRGDNGYPGPQR
jgi:hypothetical protein